MIKVKFFVCKECGSVSCIDPKDWNETFYRCTKCKSYNVESLDDDFDLSEIADNVKEDS